MNRRVDREGESKDKPGLRGSQLADSLLKKLSSFFPECASGGRGGTRKQQGEEKNRGRHETSTIQFALLEGDCARKTDQKVRNS